MTYLTATGTSHGGQNWTLLQIALGHRNALKGKHGWVLLPLPIPSAFLPRQNSSVTGLTANGGRLKPPCCQLGSPAAVAAPARRRAATATHKQPGQWEQWEVETKAGGNTASLSLPQIHEPFLQLQKPAR